MFKKHFSPICRTDDTTAEEEWEDFLYALRQEDATHYGFREDDYISAEEDDCSNAETLLLIKEDKP